MEIFIFMSVNFCFWVAVKNKEEVSSVVSEQLLVVFLYVTFLNSKERRIVSASAELLVCGSCTFCFSFFWICAYILILHLITIVVKF